MPVKAADHLHILFAQFEIEDIIVFCNMIRIGGTGDGIQERLSVLAAPRMVRSTFLFARLRSAGGVYLSGGLKPATETSRILTYPPLIEAGGFPTEIKPACSCHRSMICAEDFPYFSASSLITALSKCSEVWPRLRKDTRIRSQYRIGVHIPAGLCSDNTDDFRSG